MLQSHLEGVGPGANIGLGDLGPVLLEVVDGGSKMGTETLVHLC